MVPSVGLLLLLPLHMLLLDHVLANLPRVEDAAPPDVKLALITQLILQVPLLGERPASLVEAYLHPHLVPLFLLLPSLFSFTT